MNEQLELPNVLETDSKLMSLLELTDRAIKSHERVIDNHIKNFRNGAPIKHMTKIFNAIEFTEGITSLFLLKIADDDERAWHVFKGLIIDLQRAHKEIVKQSNLDWNSRTGSNNDGK